MPQTGRDRLGELLKRLDGRGYPAYRNLEGSYPFERWTLSIDRVQGDPFAAPSRLSARVTLDATGFPGDTFGGRSREIALRDLIARQFVDACRRIPKESRGSGNSGWIAIERPGQEILDTSAVVLTEGHLEARFTAGLPAYGRRIAGRAAEEMLCVEIPRIVEGSLFFSAYDRDRLHRHVLTCEDACAIRSQLPSLGLVAFVADGAILPRRSGVDDRPMERTRAVPFESPPSLRVRVNTPNSGEVTGMGIREGVTLIVGGGFHGKSTLLFGIERGVYDHVPGDGREFVIARGDAVRIRAEDGRRIEKNDVSPFLTNLPFMADTSEFSTDDVSGSTSQAANILEAMEVGTSLLLIDEDASATNFMIRDHRMQELLHKDLEPITPFIDRVRQIYAEHGVSTILVIGGSGDYFDVADTVVCMAEYRPVDVTGRARSIAEKYRSERRFEGTMAFGPVQQRAPLPGTFDPGRGRRPVKIAIRDRWTIAFGREAIDLSAISQLVHAAQTRAIGFAMLHAVRFMDGATPLRRVIDLMMGDLADKGLDALRPGRHGDLAAFRRQELAAAINRLRTLEVRNLNQRQ
ncbi:MAG: ABC-ATPase domain-containing protein [Methanomicrobiales archaeon]|nr:ABC-ATPase domain-containing protein [Methanomicrobiales archaeon]